MKINDFALELKPQSSSCEFAEARIFERGVLVFLVTACFGRIPDEFGKYHTCVLLDCEQKRVSELNPHLESQEPGSNKPAKIGIYKKEKLIASVVSKVEKKLGKVGGYYHYISLIRQT